MMRVLILLALGFFLGPETAVLAGTTFGFTGKEQTWVVPPGVTGISRGMVREAGRVGLLAPRFPSLQGVRFT